jgi:LmbE family N-acetylglucosaminyl deacetylase
MMTSAAAADSLMMPPAPAVRRLPRAGSVLVVAARPGRESTDLGGLLYAFRRSGASLALLCLTRGEAELHLVPAAGSGPALGTAASR